MKIAFDLDDVCVSTTTTMIDYLNNKLPITPLTINDITSYHIEDALPEDFKWLVEIAFQDKNFWKQVSIIPECVPILNKLYNEGYNIVFATSSLPENLRKKINHLSRNLTFFPDDYVWKHTINLQDKSLLNVDILVDDNLKHLLHPNRLYYSIIMNWPWNQLSDDFDRVCRAYDWNDVYAKVKQIERGEL